MNQADDPHGIAAMHTTEAIKERINSASQHSYLGDFVLGAVDGAVTTFAIVAGAAGANLPAPVAIVLGLANVVADAFSMGASNYLKARSDRQILDRFRQMEEMHIDQVPEAEREEIRQIFANKGFDGEMLEDVVGVITKDRKQWVDTMLTEEWGLQLDSPSPLKAALVTTVAFVVAGLVPLIPLVIAYKLATERLFVASAILTAVTFFMIGWIRGRLSDRKPWSAGLETLLIGGAAAGLAYAIGLMLRGFATG